MSSKRRKKVLDDEPFPVGRDEDGDLYDFPEDDDGLDDLYDESDLESEELDEAFDDEDDEGVCEHGIPYDEWCEECAEDEEEDPLDEFDG